LIFAPVIVRAQTAGAVRRIGTLSSGARPPPDEFEHEFDPLQEIGWIEGKNLVIERRYTNGNAELLRPFAEELVQLKVELIVTNGTDSALAVRNATTTIPIILWGAGDPVRTGLVETLARPGGNVTGMSIVSTEIDAKRLSLLREVLPAARRVGVLLNSTNPISAIRKKDSERIYPTLGLQPIIIEVGAGSEIDPAIAEIFRQRGEALVIPSDSLFYVNRDALLRAALKRSLPSFVASSEMLEAGALVSYSHSLPEIRRRVAAFIDKILRGAKPADLPIEQPTKFELGINLKTAKSLGLTIPRSLLLRADEVLR
jgi:putative ABC transport system substrate-binding protein